MHRFELRCRKLQESFVFKQKLNAAREGFRTFISECEHVDTEPFPVFSIKHRILLQRHKLEVGNLDPKN